jgi:hypothetical protein
MIHSPSSKETGTPMELDNPLDAKSCGSLLSFQREGRIQSAERAVPTLAFYNLANLLSA